MTISIKATNMELTEALKDYAEKRLSSIGKYGALATVEAEIGKSTNHHRNGDIFIANVNVTTSLGKLYRAETEKADLYEAIDVVRDELVRELKSAKGKEHSLFKRGAQRVKNILKGFRS